eukprot:7439994-Pyramimonas_sp.AAC.1
MERLPIIMTCAPSLMYLAMSSWESVVFIQWVSFWRYARSPSTAVLLPVAPTATVHCQQVSQTAPSSVTIPRDKRRPQFRHRAISC